MATAVAVARREAIALPRVHELVWVGLAASAAAVLYIWAGIDQHHMDGWFPLAQSILDGRFSVPHDRPWIEYALSGDGQWYLPFPPVPVLPLLPIVALFGQDFVDLSGMTGLVGGLNVLLMWLVVRRFLPVRESVWLTVAFAVGSEVLWVAALGSVHLWTETLGLGLELGALTLAVRRRYPYLGGVLLLLAAGCRPTFLLAVPAFLILYAPDWRRWQKPAMFCLGAAPIGILLLVYNVLRFGSPVDFGYDRIIYSDGTSVLSLWYYQQGTFSLAYIPRGLVAMFGQGFTISHDYLWPQPMRSGASILLTMPVLVYVLRAPRGERIARAAWLGMALPLVLDLMHGNPGRTQFGYRFFLDGIAFAWVLLALTIRSHGLTAWMRAAVVAGVIVNTYGVICDAYGWLSPQ